MQETGRRTANPFAMPSLQASRRLVKSPPELWAEVSDAASLARHLGEVGEITITRLEPETTVAWEGEHASGTVELAPAGWGTAVTLTAEPATIAEPTAAPEPEPAPEPAPEPEPAAEPQPRPTWLRRLFRRRGTSPADRASGGEDALADRPDSTGLARQAPTPEAEEPEPLEAVLASALDSLGSAHHRPFSRG